MDDIIVITKSEGAGHQVTISNLHRFSIKKTISRDQRNTPDRRGAALTGGKREGTCSRRKKQAESPREQQKLLLLLFFLSLPVVKDSG